MVKRISSIENLFSSIDTQIKLKCFKDIGVDIDCVKILKERLRNHKKVGSVIIVLPDIFSKNYLGKYLSKLGVIPKHDGKGRYPWDLEKKDEKPHLLLNPIFKECGRESVKNVIRTGNEEKLSPLKPKEVMACILNGLIKLNGSEIYCTAYRGKEMMIWRGENKHHMMIARFSKDLRGENIKIPFCEERVFIT